MQQLIDLDKKFFLFINNGLSNPFFDAVMPFIRNATFWVPMYVFLLVFGFLNFRKSIWWWIAFAAATAAIGDIISSTLIKENITRLRPVRDPEIMDRVIFLLNYKPKSSSFTSSHAVNHFALATFFYYTLKPFIHKYALLFFAWASLVCFAQVYVGVHFPLDVICGGLIGFFIGKITSTIFAKNFYLQLND